MTDRDKLNVSFSIEQRDGWFWFRKATHPDFDRRGPYRDLDEVIEAVCAYTREDLLEFFEHELAPEQPVERVTESGLSEDDLW